MIDKLTNTIKISIDESVPKCRITPTSKPLPNNIKVLIHLRNVYRRNWKRYRDPYDHGEMTKLNKIITEEIIIFKNKSWNSMLSSLDKASSPFWKISKILKKNANFEAQ